MNHENSNKLCVVHCFVLNNFEAYFSKKCCTWSTVCTQATELFKFIHWTSMQNGNCSKMLSYKPAWTSRRSTASLGGNKYHLKQTQTNSPLLLCYYSLVKNVGGNHYSNRIQIKHPQFSDSTRQQFRSVVKMTCKLCSLVCWSGTLIPAA